MIWDGNNYSCGQHNIIIIKTTTLEYSLLMAIQYYNTKFIDSPNKYYFKSKLM